MRNYPAKGVTLAEVLIVVAILALLSAILYAALFSGRRGSREAVCMSQMRQIGMAVRMYEGDYDILPVRLRQLHPAYLPDQSTFRCPQWEAQLTTRPDDVREKARRIFSMYTYTPEEVAFWAKIPPEGREPVRFREAWEETAGRRGERMPLLLCQYHDPLLSVDRAPVSSGMFQMTRLVLRVDGSVGKSTARGKHSVDWRDL